MIARHARGRVGELALALALTAALLLLAAYPLRAADARTVGRSGAAASGQKIAYVSDRDGDSEIYAMNADGSARTRLTTNAGWDMCPDISREGTKIVFISSRDGQWADVFIMNADGSGQTRVAAITGTQWGPVFSPDGLRIAFSSNHDGDSEIYTMKLDGSDLAKLTDNTVDDSRPTYSPDGWRIAFQSARDGIHDEIYSIYTDGSGQTRLTENEVDDRAPAWSPDGRRIAFVSYFRDAGLPSGIYTMDTDGSGQTRLTTDPGDGSCLAFSPDSASSYVDGRIAFSSTRDGTGSEIYVMKTDGTFQTRLTNDAAHASWPSWGVGAVVVPAAQLTRPWVSTRVVTAGRGFSVGGFISPPHNGRAVTLFFERSVGGAWRAMSQRTATCLYSTETQSQYEIALRLTQRGKWRVRAYHGDAEHAATWSSYRSFQVRSARRGN